MWIYDLRTSMPQFGKTRPLSRAIFQDFEAAFGPGPHGRLAGNNGEDAVEPEAAE